MSDKRDLSIYFAKYILQNYGCSKFFRHFFAVFSHLGEISTPICVEGISWWSMQPMEEVAEKRSVGDFSRNGDF